MPELDVKMVYDHDYRGRLVRVRMYRWDLDELEWPDDPDEDTIYIYYGSARLKLRVGCIRSDLST